MLRATFAERTASFSLRVLVAAAGLVAASGCQPAGAPPSDTAVTPADVDAEVRLRDVFRRYQVTSYYDDDGIVILHAPGANAFHSNETETAPLSVHFDPRELAVEAYTARIRVQAHNETASRDTQRTDMVAWFDEPQTSHFDSQVLRQQWQAAVTDRVPLPRVLNDEVLRARLSAGLAGPPPQLEWLLADHPMQKLFEPQTRFEWLRPATIDSVELQRIAVTSKSERFVFWIDANSSLIRRVELPLPDLAAIGARIDRGGWSLRLELRSATFQPPATGRVVEFPHPPRQPKLVRAFVPLPPPPPSPLIGQQVSLRPLWESAFDRQGESPAGIEYLLIAVPPAEASDIPAWLQTWMQSIPTLTSPGFRSTDVVMVASDHDVRRVLRDLPITIVAPSLVDRLVRQLRMDAGEMRLVQSQPANSDAGKILLCETATNPSTMSNAFAVIRDSAAGVDVAARIKHDYDAILREYNAKLRDQRMD